MIEITSETESNEKAEKEKSGERHCCGFLDSANWDSDFVIVL